MKARDKILAIIAFGIFVAFAEVVAANGAEIKVFTARAGATVLDKMRAALRRAAGHTLNVIYALVIGGSLRKIRAGESFDFLIFVPSTIDALIKEGKILA